MESEENEMDGGQVFATLVNVEPVVYGAQDLIGWDEPENYNEEDLSMIVV